MSLVAIAGQTFRLRVELESQSAAGTFQSSPTVAAGDVKLLILPASPAGTETYANSTNAPTLLNGPTAEVIIAAAETTAAGDGGEIIAVWADAAGAQWYSLAAHIQVKAADVAVAGDQMDLVNAPNATAVTAIQAGLAATGADGDTLETLSDQLDALPADTWSYTTRTLTQSSTSTTDSTAAGSIARRRGDSWSISLTIGAITGYTSLWFTAKWDRDDPDISSVLQIKLNSPSASDGLLYVNGAAASDSTKGSITVSDDTTGAIIIAVDETITQYLPPAGLYYDIQVLNSGTVTTPDSGTFTITADVTRSVT